MSTNEITTSTTASETPAISSDVIDAPCAVYLEQFGKPVHSLQEIREHCDITSLLAQHHFGTLVRWLRFNYYEREAEQLDGFKVRCEKDRRYLLKVLGIEDDVHAEWLTGEEQCRLSTVNNYTQDDVALRRFRQVALNQEEMGQLIDNGEDEIILCHGTFSIPIKKSGIHYLVRPGTSLEAFYTAEQYLRAGIRVEGGNLPKVEIPESVIPARLAAEKNGYDFYLDEHSSFAVSFHSLMRNIEYTGDGSVPLYAAHDIRKNYQEYAWADYARNRYIRELYECADAFFSDEFIHTVADYYQKELEAAFAPFQALLQKLFTHCGLAFSYTSLMQVLSTCGEFLVNAMHGELEADPDYYRLYDLGYFIDKTGIEKCHCKEQTAPNSLSKLFKIPEEYRCIGIPEVTYEMNSDMQKSADTFYRAAKTHYDRYCGKIEFLLERLETFLPTMASNESIKDYLSRAATTTVFTSSHQNEEEFQ